MNTKLYQSTLNIPCQDMNGTSSVPALLKVNFKSAFDNIESNLGEDEDLYLGYGHVVSAFPYKMQDMYTRPLHDNEEPVIILENEYLKATFLPNWGGKLMSLIDKEKNKELLYCNPVIRPCNLAIRNAWASGGIEWNCGFVAHHPHTCETMFTTTTQLDDGTPVLRMYEFERIRQVVQQMDFFLPEGSKVLFVRNRIINPRTETIPAYWWSNIAVVETPDTRVIVNADTAYMAEDKVCVKSMLDYCGADGTYPVDVPYSVDFFYKIPFFARRFEAAVDADGYGLVQTSTHRLRGRKLFCWGQNPGGDRWQEFLTFDGSTDRYIEIQAGLGRTQYGCIPMPPETTWEWLEAYGAMNADGDIAHGEWQAAKAEVAKKLDQMITAERMEELLDETRPMAKAKATGELLFKGSGWGALENMLRQKDGRRLMAAHLDLGAVDEEQAAWVSLLEKGTVGEHNPDEIPASWMLQEGWTDLLKEAIKGADANNWYAYLQLGMISFINGNFDDAKSYLDRSYELCKSPWALYGLAHINRQQKDLVAAANLCEQAYRMKMEDISLGKEAMELLTDADMNKEALELAEQMPEKVREIGRVKIYILKAYIRLGNIQKAEELFYADGGLVLPDVREGERLVTELYLDLLELKAKESGEPYDRLTAKVPPQFDYRQTDRVGARPARKRVRK